MNKLFVVFFVLLVACGGDKASDPAPLPSSSSDTSLPPAPKTTGDSLGDDDVEDAPPAPKTKNDAGSEDDDDDGDDDGGADDDGDDGDDDAPDGGK